MQKTLTMRQGMLVFILAMVGLAVVGSVVQNAWGIYGLAITELLILSFAVIPALLYKVDFKEVFSVKAPSIRQVMGSLLIWFGTYLIVMLVTQVIMYFFPEGFLAVSDSMSDLFSSSAILVALLIVAVMPAICEEMLHRGFILHTLGAQGKWQRVLLMGFVFGVFHLDPYRFVPTALLGMAFTFVMIETNNIIIPMFMHFINNALAVLFSFVESETPLLTQDQLLMTLGTYLVIAATAPFLLMYGTKLIRKPGFKMKTKGKIIAVSVSLLFFLIGGYTLSSLDLNTEPLFISNMSMGVNHETTPHSLPFEVEQKDTYNLNLEMELEQGLGRLSISDSSSLVVFDTTAQQLTLTQGIDLMPGEYTCNIAFIFDEAVEGYGNCTINIRID
ncbi:MAG: CPBP family intramembrane metalloprotease [Firmicutes bacterium]|nr:CPBP family intramembrane metalloprotease [Bacillota bacterium]